jgi:hypothetical protein
MRGFYILLLNYVPQHCKNTTYLAISESLLKTRSKARDRRLQDKFQCIVRRIISAVISTSLFSSFSRFLKFSIHTTYWPLLVSALAVLVGSHAEDVDELKGKNVRLNTALLGLTRMPTRSGLLKDAVQSRINI